jgi:negative regulator of flagellin synthesis FlgM
MSTSRIDKNGPQLGPTPAEGSKAQSVRGTPVHQGQAAKSAQNKASAALKDGTFDVEISSKGKERAQSMQKAFDIAKNTPDVREDRVKQLKEQIDNGTYQVDSGNIADGMLREAIKEQLAESPE